MKYLLFVLMMVVSSITFADCRVMNSGNLSPAQVKELELNCEKMKQSVADPSSAIEKIEKVVTPENVTKWSEAANQLVGILETVARSLNIGINEFIKTPVGVLLTMLIVWSFMGKTFLYAVFCVFAWCLFLWYNRNVKISGYRTIEKAYYTWSNKEYIRKIRIPEYKERIRDSEWMVWWLYFGMAFTSTIMMLVK